MSIKVKVKDIKSNPFKQFINNGKLDGERVEKLVESIEHGTLPNSFFARKKDGVWELAHGHHRLAAFKKKYGADFELEVLPVEYSDELMLVDMIRENLTHRDSDFSDTKDSVVLARAWLESGVNSVKDFDKIKKSLNNPKGAGRPHELDSCRSIGKFLSKQGKTISLQTISDYISIEDNLSPELKKMVGKLETALNEEKKNKIGVWLAATLSRLPKKEQQPIYERINKEGLTASSAREKIRAYNQVDEKIKDQVRKGTIKLSDVPAVIKAQELEAKVFDQDEPPEPDSVGKAIALQDAFNKAQSEWQNVLAILGTKKTIHDCKFSKMEIKAFVKDIEDTNKHCSETLKSLKEVLK